ncbi:MAG: T9SS type A sorting domain-containing protein, partial [Rhodothermales bacterium]|nr:T9SS type A sorting domain-containing protein [Rhodothermales bacterium]
AALTDYAGVPQPPDNPGGCLLNGGLDAHALSTTPGVAGEPVLEVLTGYPGEHPRNRVTRVVVLDRWGRNRGAETPLFELPTPDGYGDVLEIAGVVRSRLDPSVLYLTVITGFAGDGRYWVYAVRAAPLPPVWLHASPILFGVEAESEAALTLSVSAEGLEPGAYEAVASVRAGDGIGPVVAEVPVVLTVVEGTAAEDAQPDASAPSLSVWPNPSVGATTVEVELARSSEAEVVVMDVLGRRVAVLHRGPLAAGSHRLALDGRALRPGLYVVRAAVGDEVHTRRVTLVL